MHNTYEYVRSCIQFYTFKPGWENFEAQRGMISQTLGRELIYFTNLLNNSLETLKHVEKMQLIHRKISNTSHEIKIFKRNNLKNALDS